MKKLTQVPSWDDIQETHKAIKGMIHQTPVMASHSINEITGAEIYFKCENFQKVGAFKMRGASSAALRLTEEEKAKGIATHSSGNHAQAVALSARTLGIPAYIVMPNTSPEIKKKGTAGYGAEITECENSLAAREEALNAVVARTGATFIHPYDDYNVIAGQATAAKELLAAIPDLDIIMSPVGGGGLMSGTALAARYISPGIKVYGAEPAIVDDAARSLAAGHLLTNDRIDTIADGLRTNLSEKTFAIIQQHVDQIFTVSEEAIIAAMRLTWERMKIIIEPSCAVPLAVVMTYPDYFNGRKTGIILTGGNVDLDHLPF
ncbi:MAG: threonine/serine dehydratase [Saprospiraceae bacterium]